MDAWKFARLSSRSTLYLCTKFPASAFSESLNGTSGKDPWDQLETGLLINDAVNFDCNNDAYLL